MNNIFLRFGFFICLLGFAAPVLRGQADERGPFTGGAGYLAIGGASLDCDGLNESMAGSGYSGFGGGFPTLGGGGYAVVGQLVLGGEGRAYLAKSRGNASFKTSLAGASGFFQIGWIVHAGRGFRVFPLIGLGAGSVHLDITGSSPAPFEEVIADPKRSARLQTSGFLLDPGMAVEHWFGRGRAGRSRFFVGVRAGYVFAPARSGWELEKMEIEGGPKLNLGGPHLRLVIGAGSAGGR